MTSFIAKVPLEKLDIPATLDLQESQVSMGPKGTRALCAQTVLSSQGLRGPQVCREETASKASQENGGQLASKESQGPQEVRVFQDFQDTHVLRVTQDLKEKKAKWPGQREKWVTQGTPGPEGSLEDPAWMEFLEPQE